MANVDDSFLVALEEVADEVAHDQVRRLVLRLPRFLQAAALAHLAGEQLAGRGATFQRMARIQMRRMLISGR